MINASVVLYHTPKEEVENIRNILLQSGVVSHVEWIDNGAGKNVGYGAGHNIAMRKTLAEGVPYHLVVNADVSFDPAILRQLLDYMETHPEVGQLMPKVVYPSGETQYVCKLLPTPLNMFDRRFLPDSWMKHNVFGCRTRNEQYELRASGYDRIMNVPYLSGCFMLFRTAALREAGLFDERFFMYPEDIDLTRRIHRHYQTIFYPEATIVHHHAQASYKNHRLLRVHVINMCRYFNKWGWFDDQERVRFNREVIAAYLPER